MLRRHAAVTCCSVTGPRAMGKRARRVLFDASNSPPVLLVPEGVAIACRTRIYRRDFDHTDGVF